MMARRKNPGAIVWVALIGGGVAAAYFLTRKKAIAATAPPNQAVHDLPAADVPPTQDEVAATCYEADRPLDEPGYEWRCARTVHADGSSTYSWKKRRTGRTSRVPPLLTMSLLAKVN